MDRSETATELRDPEPDLAAPVSVDGDEPELAAADLTATFLDEEEVRRQEAAEADAQQQVVLPDDVLPGVGDEALSTRDVIRKGGVSTVLVLSLLNLVDEFDRAAVVVLAPDIQSTLGVSDTVLAVLTTIGGILIVLGAVPIGYLADRVRRTSVISGVAGIFGVFMFATGFVQSAWQFGVSRVGTGFGKGGGPAYNAVLADAYPVGGRARMFALYNMANPLGLLIAPALAGVIAALAGGDEGWRWAFIVLAIPGLVLAVVSLFLREPRRGRNEQLAVFGTEDAALTHEPPRLSAAFARLKKIRTFYYLLVGLGIMGFALFSFSVFFSLFLEEHYGLDALDRGYVLSLKAIGGVAGALFGGWAADRVFRRNPAKAIMLTAGLLTLFGFGVVAMYMPNLASLVPVAAVGRFGLDGAVTGILAIVASVIPFRLRSQGYAMVGIYIFFLGAFLGAVITGQLSDAMGPRTALTIVVPPSLIVGGIVMAYGARFVRHDISEVVQELQEERDENERIEQGGDVPVLQVRNLDFSYGSLQVLFDVDLDIWEGEVVALLGTNGAGKSTLLRAVSGLSPPDRGVVRLDGRTVTYTEAEERVERGLVQVPGGHAVFPSLTVHENLVVGCHTFASDEARVRERIEGVLELFPILRERADQPAGSLSGGQQQMLGIAKGLLLDPRLLMIDELSLGLAPVVVQQLFDAVGELKRRGITMIIVEQSVNVALSLADRALFMEKGRIRFEGSAEELLERDDLARAVFLGGEEG